MVEHYIILCTYIHIHILDNYVYDMYEDSMYLDLGWSDLDVVCPIRVAVYDAVQPTGLLDRQIS